MQEQTVGQIPVGSIISLIIWLGVIVAAVIASIWFMREYAKDITGTAKKTISNPEDGFLKELKESYGKLTEEQKRKIDSIK